MNRQQTAVANISSDIYLIFIHDNHSGYNVGPVLIGLQYGYCHVKAVRRSTVSSDSRPNLTTKAALCHVHSRTLPELDWAAVHWKYRGLGGGACADQPGTTLLLAVITWNRICKVPPPYLRSQYHNNTLVVLRHSLYIITVFQIELTKLPLLIMKCGHLETCLLTHKISFIVYYSLWLIGSAWQ